MNAPDPGVGWRLLKEGEVIQAGDEWRGPDGWCDRIDIGCKVGSGNYRRKVEQADGWIKLSERNPINPSEFPVWIWFHDWWREESKCESPLLVYEGFAHWSRVSHWQRAHVPAPPPVEDPEQKAYDEWDNGSWPFDPQRRDIERKTWHAAWQSALAYARKLENR